MMSALSDKVAGRIAQFGQAQQNATQGLPALRASEIATKGASFCNDNGHYIYHVLIDASDYGPFLITIAP